MSVSEKISNPGLRALSERGFIQQCSDLEALDRRMNEGPLTFYVGIDPTGSSLHIGHVVPVFAAAHLARAGHDAILLLGGGTARIGDPSGKTEARQMLDTTTINANLDRLKAQLGFFLEQSRVEARFVNNADWLADLNYIDFLRDIGRHFSVNRMLSFEAYRQRMAQGLSFLEFNYQLLQSYDFLELYRRESCELQIGGDDQWGNIISGADLIRRVEGAQARSFALTFPLMLTSEGKKMGKTAQGALFLDGERTSPFDFFQYWRNVSDADVRRFLLVFTFLSVEEIDGLVGWGDKVAEAVAEDMARVMTRSASAGAELRDVLGVELRTVIVKVVIVAGPDVSAMTRVMADAVVDAVIDVVVDAGATIADNTGRVAEAAASAARAVAINAAKERLAYEVTVLVHGKEVADSVLASARAAFGQGAGAGGGGATADQLAAMPTVHLSVAELEAGIGLLELFARSGLCSSRGEARRLVQQGGAYLNDKKVTDSERMSGVADLADGEIILRAGKKRYARLIFD